MGYGISASHGAVLAHNEPDLLAVGGRLEFRVDASHRADVGVQGVQDRQDVDAARRGRQVDARQRQIHLGEDALVLRLVEQGAGRGSILLYMKI